MNPTDDCILKVGLGDVMSLTESNVDQDASVTKLGHGTAESPCAGPKLQDESENWQTRNGGLEGRSRPRRTMGNDSSG